MGQLMQPKT
jgi:hypothetical protein